MSIKASAKPAQSLLSPHDHALILIDHQSEMAFNTKSIDVTNLRTNTGILANTANGFQVSANIKTNTQHTFAEPLYHELTQAFPDEHVRHRPPSTGREDEQLHPSTNT